MTNEEIIRERLRELGAGPVQTFPAKVIEWDEDNQAVTVAPLDGPELSDVRLKAAIDQAAEGLLIWPKLDSFVLVSIIGNDNQTAYVVKHTAIDKIELTTETDINMTCKGVLTATVEGDLNATVNGDTEINCQGTIFNMSPNGFLLEKGGETLYDLVNDLLTELQAATYANGAGATGPALNVAAFAAIQSRIPNLLNGG